MEEGDIRREVAEHWAKRFEEHEPHAEESKEPAIEAIPVPDVPVLPVADENEEELEILEPAAKRQKKEPIEDEVEEELEIEIVDLSGNDDQVEVAPIDVSSEVDDDVVAIEPVEVTEDPPKGNEPPFLPIHNPTYDNPKLKNSLTVSDLLSSPKLKSCYLFSYQHNLEFILPQFHSNTIDLTIVYQEGTVLDSPLRKGFPNIQFVNVYMAPFTSHHPKLIINFYNDDTCKIYLVSCNMTQLEFETNNQMVWQSPFLKQVPNSQNTPFKQHLFNYLKNYQKSPLNTLCLKLKAYDFEPIKSDFVSSATSKSDKFGFLGLYNSLLLKGLIPRKFEKNRQVLYQTSSISSSIRWSKAHNESANLFTHLIAPLISGKYNMQGNLNLVQNFPLRNGYEAVELFSQDYKVKPYIIFPSLSDIRNSLFGYRSGGWSHYNPFSKCNIPMNDYLQKYFFHHSYSNQRRTNSSHTKFILMSSDNFQTLDWVLFTSANMSKQAWGTTPTKDTIKSHRPISAVSNYETGVLISPTDYGSGKKLVPLEIGEERKLSDDEIPVILPFRLPPEQYKADDQPWCMKDACNLPDILGAIHLGTD